MSLTMARICSARIVFTITSIAFVAMLMHVAISLRIGALQDFSLFGAPASFVIFGYAILTLPACWRPLILLAGIVAEMVRVDRFEANGLSPHDLDLLFDFQTGFGYGLGFVATTALWIAATPCARLAIESNCIRFRY